MTNPKQNTLTGRMNPPEERREIVPIDSPQPEQPKIHSPGILVMPDKLKEAITRRREDGHKRLAAAEQRENAAFQEAAMTLVQGWLCSMEMEGTVNVNLDELTVSIVEP